LTDSLKKLRAFLDRHSLVAMLLLLIPMAVTALLDMISIGMVLPLMDAILGSASGLRIPGFSWFHTWLTEFVADGGNQLVTVSALFGLFFVIKNLCILASVWLVNRTITNEAARFSHRMFLLYLERSYTYHLSTNSSHFLHILGRTAPMAFDGWRIVLSIVLESLLAFVTMVLLILINPVVSLVSMVVLLICGAAFYGVAGPLFRKWGMASHVHENAGTRLIKETFGAVKMVKLWHLHHEMGSRYRDHAIRAAHFLGLCLTSGHIPRLYIETVVVLGALFILLSVAKTSSVSEATAMLGLLGVAGLRLMPSVNRLLSYLSELRQRSPHIDLLYKDLTEGLADREPTEHAVEPLHLRHELSLHSIAYRHPGAGRLALDNVSLTLPRGQSLGLVGASGSGKSTLTDLIMGFLQPQQGSVRVDDRDIRQCLGSWQKSIGYVAQDIQLSDDTLRRNIAFGEPDSAIDDHRVLAAIADAHLEGLLAQLPQGLNTQLGERASRFSGGERQRIGLARALYRDPDILILDEITSALDGETERLVVETIQGLSGRKTMIIIAHRLSTVKNCNRIALLQEGRLIGSGTFAQLMEHNADFRRQVESNLIARPDSLS